MHDIGSRWLYCSTEDLIIKLIYRTYSSQSDESVWKSWRSRAKSIFCSIREYLRWFSFAHAMETPQKSPKQNGIFCRLLAATLGILIHPNGHAWAPEKLYCSRWLQSPCSFNLIYCTVPFGCIFYVYILYSTLLCVVALTFVFNARISKMVEPFSTSSLSEENHQRKSEHWNYAVYIWFNKVNHFVATKHGPRAVKNMEKCAVSSSCCSNGN